MKPSGGNSPEPLDPSSFTYFVERPLGKKVGLALREKGHRVVLHLDVFRDDSPDEQWIVRAAREGWVALGADVAVRWTPNLKRAIYISGLRLFNLTRNTWPAAVKAEAFIAAMPAIERLLRKRTGPFIATINKDGKVAGVYDFTGYVP